MSPGNQVGVSAILTGIVWLALPQGKDLPYGPSCVESSIPDIHPLLFPQALERLLPSWYKTCSHHYHLRYVIERAGRISARAPFLGGCYTIVWLALPKGEGDTPAPPTTPWQDSSWSCQAKSSSKSPVAAQSPDILAVSISTRLRTRFSSYQSQITLTYLLEAAQKSPHFGGV